VIRRAYELAAERRRHDGLTVLLHASDALLTPLEELNLRGVTRPPAELRARASSVIARSGATQRGESVQALLDGVFDAQWRILLARRCRGRPSGRIRRRASTS
jgi:hypothetical protein